MYMEKDSCEPAGKRRLALGGIRAPDEVDGDCRSVVASPDAVAIALAVALQPLHATAGVTRVVASTFEPVSAAGRAGIEELQQQTVDLLNGRGVEHAVFPQRIAFNALPQIGEFLEGGSARSERQTAAALRRLLGAPELVVSVTRVQVPLFFGEGISVDVETATKLSAAEARDILRAAPGVLLQDEASAQAYSTSADAVGQDATCIGRVRAADTANVLDFWIAIDNVRKGAAVNAVQIAELLIRDYL
jgi:aspartate-semialdehyde dehydrogenase